MTTYQSPCASPENDPDDWFISRDGKQYPDQDSLTPEALERIQDDVDALDLRADDFIEAVDKAVDKAEAEAKRTALQHRRHAREACHGCYFRTNCLDKALEPMTPAMHGTWGGYYEEELRVLRTEIATRRKRSRGN